VGDTVNIEVDQMARYAARLIKAGRGLSSLLIQLRARFSRFWCPEIHLLSVIQEIMV
jgi:hypothetical protein